MAIEAISIEPFKAGLKLQISRDALAIFRGCERLGMTKASRASH